MSRKIVIESFEHIKRADIDDWIINGDDVYCVERFWCFHYRSAKMANYPLAWPAFVNDLLGQGKLKLLPADIFDSRRAHALSTENAVEVLERVFPEYLKRISALAQYVEQTLKDPNAQHAFKITLATELTKFFAQNRVLHNINEHFKGQEVLVYTQQSVDVYTRMHQVVSSSGVHLLAHPGITIFAHDHSRIGIFLENFYLSLKILSYAGVAVVCAPFNRSDANQPKRHYRYGISLVSLRQLQDNRRGPDFFVDGTLIRKEDVVLFMQKRIPSELRKKAESYGMTIIDLPQVGSFFSKPKEWLGLLLIVVRSNWFERNEAVTVACLLFFNYYRWCKTLEKIDIDHFVTHCDVGVPHCGRNMALKTKGTKTWYYSDSVNLSVAFASPGVSIRHPFWVYLSYDHFVTWAEFARDYFKAHPGTFQGETHVVGCLWASHVLSARTNRHTRTSFVIAVFDTSYTVNSFTNYTEGIAFAKDILRLAEEQEDVEILFKEKNPRSYAVILDQIYGPQLIQEYEKMEKHSRIKFLPSSKDSSECIAIADLTVSFPFTSTTFEALSVNKRALWHDPKGFYRDTPYAQIKGVVTHGYEQLSLNVKEAKRAGLKKQIHPFPAGSELMDPYRDGLAIERFRMLLAKS